WPAGACLPALVPRTRWPWRGSGWRERGGSGAWVGLHSRSDKAGGGFCAGRGVAEPRTIHFETSYDVHAATPLASASSRTPDRRAIRGYPDLCYAGVMGMKWLTSLVWIAKSDQLANPLHGLDRSLGQRSHDCG